MILNPRNRFVVANQLLAAVDSRRIRVLLELMRNLAARRTLVKDPLAALSAEWLAEVFNMRVVVVVRHPAAVTASYARLGWSHPMEDFFEQDSLIRDHGSIFLDDYERAKKAVEPERTAFVWKFVYSMLERFNGRHPDWFFVRYEDVVDDPVVTFRYLFDQLNLKLTDAIRERIHPRAGRSPDLDSAEPYGLDRDGRVAANRWRHELSRADLHSILACVGSVFERFYARDEC
jgi:hypothetical protein